MSRATFLIVPGLLLAGAFAAAAQAPKPVAPPKGPLTTASGVYTAAQAARGERTYMNICVTCHPAGAYAVPEFRQKWNNAPLSQLFDFISDTMPKNEPGSLTPEEYADALAFILRINKAPAGKTELPADAAALRRIRIRLE